MNLYGLLYVSDVAEAVNCSVSDRLAMLKIYADNALVLSHSLKSFGGLTVLTNNAEILNEISPGLQCLEIPFGRDVPEGISFRSAHHKLDVFKYFADQPSGYHILLDLDMICSGEIPARLHALIDRSIPLFYDISDQVVSVYGEDVVLGDMKQLGGDVYEGRWAGGEFIAGPPSFFESLNRYIEPVWGEYVIHCGKLHHQGDEMIVSVALEKMRHDGFYMVDAGMVGGVGRYWSGCVKHAQPKFRYFLDNSWLLHLPQDKSFLSGFAGKNNVSGVYVDFIGKYFWYIRWRCFVCFFKGRLSGLFFD